MWRPHRFFPEGMEALRSAAPRCNGKLHGRVFAERTSFCSSFSIETAISLFSCRTLEGLSCFALMWHSLLCYERWLLLDHGCSALQDMFRNQGKVLAERSDDLPDFDWHTCFRSTCWFWSPPWRIPKPKCSEYASPRTHAFWFAHFAASVFAPFQTYPKANVYLQ